MNISLGVALMSRARSALLFTWLPPVLALPMPGAACEAGGLTRSALGFILSDALPEEAVNWS